jgi:hypothetical protein
MLCYPQWHTLVLRALQIVYFRYVLVVWPVFEPSILVSYCRQIIHLHQRGDANQEPTMLKVQLFLHLRAERMKLSELSLARRIPIWTDAEIQSSL